MRVRLRDLAGTVLAESAAHTLGPVAAPVPAGTLETPHPGGEDIVVWEAEWISADGEILDIERAVATLGTDLGGLLDLEPASVDLQVTAHDDTWRIRLQNRGPHALVAPVVHAAHPWAVPGHLIVEGEPSPLFPGEERVIEARWSGVDRRDRALSLDAWNLAPQQLVALADS